LISPPKEKQVPHIDQELIDAFITTNDQLYAADNAKYFKLLNESVYRYHFLKNINPSVNVEQEWHKIDAICWQGNSHYLIEFKHYDRSICTSFNSAKKDTIKGGPGPKNFGEFLASSKKLLDFTSINEQKQYNINIKSFYFILTFCEDANCTSKNRFDSYYKKEVVLRALKNIHINASVLYEAKQTKIENKIIGGFILKYKKMNGYSSYDKSDN
jgi:hypothetical protein